MSHFLDRPPASGFMPGIWFAIGVVLFGIGTAFNQGCGVSTLSKLSRGDLRMIATIIGWLIGWSILAKWLPDVPSTELPLPTLLTYTVLIALSIGIGIWSFAGDEQRRKLWFGMLGTGLLAGFIFLYESRWPVVSYIPHLTLEFHSLHSFRST